MRLIAERDWMLFIDGENFAKRGQDVLKDAGVPLTAGPHWRRDVFLWFPDQASEWSEINGGRLAAFVLDYSWVMPVGQLRRAYYYTSSESDEPEWTETRTNIRRLGFEPHLFKRKKGRSKAVDVALTSDVLTLGASRQYEVAVIVAGDGDYVPLVESVKRLGLHVGVAFLDAGVSPELQIAADEYVDVTKALVRAWSGVEGDPEGAKE